MFSGFLQFKGNFVDAQNNYLFFKQCRNNKTWKLETSTQKDPDWAPLKMAQNNCILNNMTLISIPENNLGVTD